MPPCGSSRPWAPLRVLLVLLALPGAAETGVQENRECLQEARRPALLQRSARVALHYFNYRVSSPTALRVLRAVKSGRAWINPDMDKRCVVDVAFTTDRFHLEKKDPFGNCSARVIFRRGKPGPNVNVTCKRLRENPIRLGEDYALYYKMRKLKVPLGNVSIPDNHGNIDPSLTPIWYLAFLGSSYVMWNETTQPSRYSMAKINGVQQWKLSNSGIDFQYTVLLHEFSTQELRFCSIHLFWHPGRPLVPLVSVSHRCRKLSAKASGTEEGSAAPPITQ